MDIKSFLYGAIISGAVLFFTGFLKKAGEDFYALAKRKISPKSVEKHSPHMIIHVNKDNAPQTAQDISKGKLENPLLERVNIISVDDITSTILNAPPLQRNQLVKNYVGLKVEWDTLYRGGRLVENDLIRLQLSVINAKKNTSVWCQVPANEYRELAILPENSKIRISGEIDEIGDFGVSIKDARLHIYGKPN